MRGIFFGHKIHIDPIGHKRIRIADSSAFFSDLNCMNIFNFTNVMWGTCISNYCTCKFFKIRNIFHFKVNFFSVNITRSMQAIHSRKNSCFSNYFFFKCESYGTTTSVSTKRTFVSIGIKILHFKISVLIVIDTNKTIRSNSLMTIT